MNNPVEHTPVLLQEVISTFKNIHPEVWIADATLGRGGHFFELLKHHNKLIGLDADIESIEYVKKKLLEIKGWKQESSSYFKSLYSKKEVYLVKKNFSEIGVIINNLNIKNLGGVLADLGINTYQIKESGRGFSFLNLHEPLDMRISENDTIKASDLVNSLSLDELTSLFKNLGEVSNSRQVSKNIVNFRKYKRIKTVGDFLESLKLTKRKDQKRHPATQIFMALRIAVNREPHFLKKFLEEVFKNSEEMMANVITFHSLEEKTVTDFIKNNNFKYQVYLPTEEEVKSNRSSRSSKLFNIEK